jgi:hypothetical protein
MDGGNLCDALVDFTSGLSEMISLKEDNYKTDEGKKETLRKQLLKKHEQHALMCCAISVRQLFRNFKNSKQMFRKFETFLGKKCFEIS